MRPFNWTCPHCEKSGTIQDHNVYLPDFVLTIDNKDGPRWGNCLFIVCPNPECNRFTFAVSLHEASKGDDGKWKRGKELKTWRLIPESRAKVFPSYIPQAILEDYAEACLIADLSPKASATLSRRCLQGVIRDFWKVKAGRLVDEIDAIKDKVDSDTWDAIDAVRKVGNIGAHMEKDINVIVDVDPKEAT